MADPSPCPICEQGGGFHDQAQHVLSVETAEAKWGPPYLPIPDEYMTEHSYQPYVFIVGQDEYVVILKKVRDEMHRGRPNT